MHGDLLGDRIRSIREERGEKQPEYAVTLNATAKRLKISKNYSPSTVSRLETGRQEFTLEDVLIVAATDPQKRGRDWLAWGDSPISKAELPPHPETIRETRERAIEAPPMIEQPRRAVGGKRPGR